MQTDVIEEKKIEATVVEEEGTKVDVEFAVEDDDFGEDTYLVPLTGELKALFGDKNFTTEEELHEFMDTNGIADYRIVLVEGNVFLNMPTDQHNNFSSRTVF